MQYGQNISIPYSQPQNDHNNMFSNDHKDNILKTKMERDRDDGKLHIYERKKKKHFIAYIIYVFAQYFGLNVFYSFV